MTPSGVKKLKTTITKEIDLSYVEIKEDLYLLNCRFVCTEQNTDGKIVHQDIETRECFTSQKFLQSLMREDDFEPDDIPSGQNYIILKSEHREHLALNGWMGIANTKKLPALIKSGGRMEAFNKGEWDASDLYRQYRGDVFKDLDGNMIPVAIWGSGMFGGFHDKNYDLAKALEVLKARPDVRISREKVHDYQEITYDDIGDYHQICFRFTPSAEMLPELEGLDDVEAMKVVVERDFLGLAAAGAKLEHEISDDAGPKGP